MKLPWADPLAAARARIATEETLHRRARLTVRALWDAAVQLEASTSPVPEPAVIAALRREAVRAACQALPISALAHTANARLLLGRLLERGLDEVPADEVAPVLAVAREAHARALETLEVNHAEEHQLVRQRQLTVATFAITVCLVASVVGQLLVRGGEPTDLAAGRPFTTSSKWADCHPEKSECGNLPMRVAFHTLQDQSPWYQVDLGAPTAFSSASIVNRQDMLMMRALPLVLEVSDDGKAFREVARRTEAFTYWSPTFPPQSARYFRVRVDRPSTLHLEAVRVHP